LVGRFVIQELFFNVREVDDVLIRCVAFKVRMILGCSSRQTHRP
jgi:hypothetical protein